MLPFFLCVRTDAKFPVLLAASAECEVSIVPANLPSLDKSTAIRYNFISYRTIGNLFYPRVFEKYMAEPISTRDKIIDAAFSFYRKPVFTHISLSQIAQKVGISKAAIFKHFPRKESIRQAMNARMFDGIAEVVRRMLECYQNGKRIEAMSEAVDFLVNHREYVMYFQS